MRGKLGKEWKWSKQRRGLESENSEDMKGWIEEKRKKNAKGVRTRVRVEREKKLVESGWVWLDLRICYC